MKKKCYEIINTQKNDETDQNYQQIILDLTVKGQVNGRCSKSE